MQRLSRRLVLLVLVCCLASGIALVGTWPNGSSRAASLPVLRIVERDFSLRAPKRAAAGDVLLVVENDGPESHELMVVRRPRGALPFRRDRLTVDEERLEDSKALLGELEPAKAGAVRELRLHLAPGRYELFCNMTGHYLGGMHLFLTVR